uniref:NADH dehydrogenase subunit 6 n=1 Tax=Margattea multipunctata TaxID=1928782 RepID=UPI0027A3ED71|nr:NADH dehydrogenase subunit 6 [Margattea multipunctata]WGO57311.1 NADH dehydrogenase subunit 6 [Margattea multipunctata]
MKITLLYLSSLISVMFINSNHPMMMGLILLIQTIIIVLITGMISQTFWFSYILFLIFIGGMLILFIYVTSLASNEIILMSKKPIMLILMTIIVIMLFSNYDYSYLLSQDNSLFINLKNSLNNQIIKLYNLPNQYIIIMLGSYLFLTLIAVVKITNIFKGPLRKMN